MTEFNTTHLNRIGSEPDLRTAMDILKREIFLGLNCHAVGTVQSFNSASLTVTATINYKQTFLEADPKTGIYSSVLVDYPVLLDLPVFMPQGGLASLTMPITAGDTCLILFNDLDIDTWFATGQVGPVPTQRLHSFSDGFALIGVRPATKPLDHYDPDRAVLQHGTTLVGVSSSKVKIANQGGSLESVLAGLCDVIATALNTIVPLSGAPVTAYKTTIGNLLE